MTKTLVSSPDPEDQGKFTHSELELGLESTWYDLLDELAPGKQYEPSLVQATISKACGQIEIMLLDKNRKYGNSALEPIRIFSRSGPKEQINVRIDDKLGRIKNRQDDDTEDTIDDLIGYLMLLKVQASLDAI